LPCSPDSRWFDAYRTIGLRVRRTGDAARAGSPAADRLRRTFDIDRTILIRAFGRPGNGRLSTNPGATWRHRGRARPGAGALGTDLRDCASSERMPAMAIELQSAEDREQGYQRTAVVGRALADPKRLCVLESL